MLVERTTKEATSEGRRGDKRVEAADKHQDVGFGEE